MDAAPNSSETDYMETFVQLAAQIHENKNTTAEV